MPPDAYLGIEGGGTKTTALAATADGRIVRRVQCGPGNIRLLRADGLTKLFSEIAKALPAPSAIGIGLAGVRTPADEANALAAVRSVWGETPAVVTHDLRIALRAARTPIDRGARILVLSGTGSCCYGENAREQTAKVGGWGHLLGDIGSGYDIALRGLRAAIFHYDRHQLWTRLGTNLLRALALNAPEAFIDWAQDQNKAAIAQLAPAIFDAATAGDALAKEVLRNVAADLARDAVICAGRLSGPAEPAVFVMAGSVLQRQPAFARAIGRQIQAERPHSRITILDREGAWGAAQLAIERAQQKPSAKPAAPKSAARPEPSLYVPEFDPRLSPTEQRNPKSTKLDRLTIPAAVSLMMDADAEIVPALRQERQAIERAVRLASASLSRAGRILYVGAGTSGRLGVLDSSECPPTFRASPEMVQGIIAGGQTALWRAAEGAEDDGAAGAAAIAHRQVAGNDTVIGIAASGRTPFVWGALAEAKKRGARTILVCFNPALKIAPGHKPDVVIAPNLGPEILTGSTRLKCGTATKLILNMISTLAMVRLGKVASNLMVDLNPSNVKLRDRAIRIVSDLRKCSATEAEAALEKHRWVVKDALQSLGRKRRSAAR